MKSPRLVVFLALLLPVFAAPGAAEEEPADSLLDHCEFESPEIAVHYFPVFREDPMERDGSLPLMDLLIDPEGQPIQLVLLGKNLPEEEAEQMKLAARFMRFTPAVACGEPVEGFSRMRLDGYFFVEKDSRNSLTKLPQARFVIPQSFFSTLRVQRLVGGESQLEFTLAISPDGRIDSIEGHCEWSKFLSRQFLKQYFKGFVFTNPMADEEAVGASMRLVIHLEEPENEANAFAGMEGASPKRPMPIKPEGLHYAEPREFMVGLSRYPNGWIREVQFFDELKPAERISVLNAVRNWCVPHETEDAFLSDMAVKMAFIEDSERAVLLGETFKKDLIQPPRRLKGPSPQYPREAKRRGIQGAVEIFLVVDKEGNVAFAEATASSHPTFVNSSLKAIRKWKFEPARFEGKPVNMRCRIIVPYIFHE